eukprot:Colp12_sorted_trinity150504_noHs@28853
MDVRSKINAALALKEDGNEFFKRGDTKKAKGKYHQAIMYVKSLDVNMYGRNCTEDEAFDVRSIQGACYTNIAACLIKEGEWQKAVDRCTECIKLQPQNAKAYFRRGQAYFSLNELDKAMTDLKHASSLEPKDTKVREEIKKVADKLKLLEAKHAAAFSGFLNKKSAASTSSPSHQTGFRDPQPGDVVMGGVEITEMSE